jgi:hypothetical protein
MKVKDKELVKTVNKLNKVMYENGRKDGIAELLAGKIISKENLIVYLMATYGYGFDEISDALGLESASYALHCYKISYAVFNKLLLDKDFDNSMFTEIEESLAELDSRLIVFEKEEEIEDDEEEEEDLSDRIIDFSDYFRN